MSPSIYLSHQKFNLLALCLSFCERPDYEALGEGHNMQRCSDVFTGDVGGGRHAS